MYDSLLATWMNWIYSFIKKYWMELLVFGVIGIALLICMEPTMTWINTNSDGIHLTFSAQYMYPAHLGSAPLYLLLGRLVLFIPFGTVYWRMALLSSVPTLIGSIFIYLIIKKELDQRVWQNKWSSRICALIGALIYSGSALVFSQSIIIKYYTLTTLFGILAYWFCINKKWLAAVIFLGCGLATHEIMLFMYIPMFIAFKPLRSWKNIGIVSAFALFYLYIPITNRAPYIWDAPNSWGWLQFLRALVSTGGELSGGLSIYDFPKRILDAGGMLLVSLGLGVVGIIVALWKTKWYKNVLFWMMIIPIVYFVTDLAPQTYVYMVPGVAFGSILAGIGLSKLKKEWLFATGGIAIVMLGFNTNYFDIGRILDKNLSAKEFFYQELNKVPDGQVLLAQNGWEWACVFAYNREFGRNIISIAVGNLPSEGYQKLWLDSNNIKYVAPSLEYDKTHSDASEQIALSIVEDNNNIWVTKATSDYKTYGAEIIPASGNEDVINETSQAISTIDAAKVGSLWQWKPNNPYDFITGALEIKNWQYLTLSNYNCIMFAMICGISAIPVWILWNLFIKKKKWSIKEVKDKAVVITKKEI